MNEENKREKHFVSLQVREREIKRTKPISIQVDSYLSESSPEDFETAHVSSASWPKR